MLDASLGGFQSRCSNFYLTTSTIPFPLRTWRYWSQTCPHFGATMYFDSHYHSAYHFLTDSWSSAESQGALLPGEYISLLGTKNMLESTVDVWCWFSSKYYRTGRVDNCDYTKSNVRKFTILKFGAVTMRQKHHRTIKWVIQIPRSLLLSPVPIPLSYNCRLTLHFILWWTTDNGSG